MTSVFGQPGKLQNNAVIIHTNTNRGYIAYCITIESRLVFQIFKKKNHNMLYNLVSDLDTIDIISASYWTIVSDFHDFLSSSEKMGQ